MQNIKIHRNQGAQAAVLMEQKAAVVVTWLATTEHKKMAAKETILIHLEFSELVEMQRHGTAAVVEEDGLAVLLVKDASMQEGEDQVLCSLFHPMKLRKISKDINFMTQRIFFLKL